MTMMIMIVMIGRRKRGIGKRKGKWGAPTIWGVVWGICTSYEWPGRWMGDAAAEVAKCLAMDA